MKGKVIFARHSEIVQAQLRVVAEKDGDNDDLTGTLLIKILILTFYIVNFV